ncbi:DMT family transporter, partial [Pseudomonas aeruginosa]
MPNYLMVLMAVSVGGMVVLQAGSNALLGRLLGHPLSASLTSLGVSLGVVSLGLL